MTQLNRAIASAVRVSAALMVLLVLSAAAVHAQATNGSSGSGLGAQLRDQLQQMGLTPDLLRQQLAARGFDPSLLDAYLNPQAQEPAQPSADVTAALDALRIKLPGDTAPTTVTTRSTAAAVEAALPDSSAMEREYGLRVFGLRTFARTGNEFEPMVMGPVPPGYRVGPGDEVVLILTGDVERSYSLPVSREGFVVVPQVGQVWVNGLTLDQLRDRLRTKLASSYSGIKADPSPTTHVEVTLGRLRSNQLFVTGEVVRPGSYLASPVASVLNALYLAGGPQPNGSFRDVRVMRAGKIADRVDLYGYLASGDDISDVVLQPGDVIFIPIHGPQVAVKGEIARPAIYEIVPGENLLDVLHYAGGLTAPAATGRARITRILPPSERTQPGLDRTVLEVDLAAVLDGDAPAPELRDGDELRIFRIHSELRNVVTVSGAIWKDCTVPGSPTTWTPDRTATTPSTIPASGSVPSATAARADSTAADSLTMAADTTPKPPEPDAATRQLCTIPFTPGMRAWQAVRAVDGLRPDAYTPRAQIVRLDPADSTLHIIPFSLEEREGVPVEDPVLMEHDAIRVFSRTSFRDSLFVRVSGEVRRGPQLQLPYREGMTLADLILEAGGLTPDADLNVEISRRADAAARAAGSLAETFRVELPPSAIVSERGMRVYRRVSDDGGDTPAPGGLVAADTIVLRPHDHVFVRRLANLEPERTVTIEGEVRYPGRYALRSKDEHLSDLVQRAGGLTRTAFAGGFQLFRDGNLVNVDLELVLAHPGSADDLVVLPGDSMSVGEYNPVVLVQGAVNSPASVLYRKGAGLDYYIASAGGYTRRADRDNVYVRYANGQGSARRTVLLFKTSPTPEPGSTVTVPQLPEARRASITGAVASVAQIAGSLTTILLLISKL